MRLLTLLRDMGSVKCSATEARRRLLSMSEEDDVALRKADQQREEHKSGEQSDKRNAEDQ